MNELSSKERIELALSGQECDHVPFCPFLAYVWETFPTDIQARGPLAFHRMIGADPLWRVSPCPVEFEYPDEMRITVKDAGDRTVTVHETPVGTLTYVHKKTAQSGDNTIFLIEHPLKTEDDFKTQLWIEERLTYRSNDAMIADHFAQFGDEGVSLGMLTPRFKTAFQSLVEHYVGTENVFYAMLDWPETFNALLDRMMANNRKAVEHACVAPYDYYLTFENSSTQNYGPDLYRQYISPEIAQWCHTLKQVNKKYVQHACGYVQALIGQMKQDGVHAVESLSPPPTGNLELAQARECFGNEMGIIGGLEPTKLLNYSLEQLADYVAQVITDGRGGPFVLANSDSCPPGVTIEKFMLIADIAKHSTVTT